MSSGSPTKSGNKKGRDFYATLGVERTANQGQIKHAYRKKAMKCHPDKNPGNEEAAEQFKDLVRAHHMFSRILNFLFYFREKNVFSIKKKPTLILK